MPEDDDRLLSREPEIGFRILPCDVRMPKTVPSMPWGLVVPIIEKIVMQQRPADKGGIIDAKMQALGDPAAEPGDRDAMVEYADSSMLDETVRPAKSRNLVQTSYFLMDQVIMECGRDIQWTATPSAPERHGATGLSVDYSAMQHIAQSHRLSFFSSRSATVTGIFASSAIS